MKAKITIIILMLMAVYCISPGMLQTADAASATKKIAVHPDIWAIHGTYVKSSTSNSVYAKNYSGYGEYEYCYTQVRSDISGTWAAYSSKSKLYKNNSLKKITLTNTIDKGKNISLRLIGADTQSTDDYNYIFFRY